MGSLFKFIIDSLIKNVEKKNYMFLYISTRVQNSRCMHIPQTRSIVSIEDIFSTSRSYIEFNTYVYYYISYVDKILYLLSIPIRRVGIGKIKEVALRL